MFHGDTKRLPLIEGESTRQAREYLFVAIDDFSRELYAAILPDKTQHSSSKFLRPGNRRMFPIPSRFIILTMAGNIRVIQDIINLWSSALRTI